jgi:hypothetical protein
VDTALSGKVSDVLAGSGISISATNGTRTVTALNVPHNVKSGSVTYSAGVFDTLEAHEHVWQSGQQHAHAYPSRPLHEG